MASNGGSAGCGGSAEASARDNDAIHANIPVKTGGGKGSSLGIGSAHTRCVWEGVKVRKVTSLPTQMLLLCQACGDVLSFTAKPDNPRRLWAPAEFLRSSGRQDIRNNETGNSPL